MYAEVLVQYGSKSLDRTFTYKIPDNLVGKIKRGMKVAIPFGKQEINGFVLNVKDISDLEYLKEINNIINSDFELNEELMSLGIYIKDKTLCSLITAYQAMLPTSLKVNNSKESYNKYDTFISLNKTIEEIDEYISNNKRSHTQIDILEIHIKFVGK